MDFEKRVKRSEIVEKDAVKTDGNYCTDGGLPPAAVIRAK